MECRMASRGCAGHLQRKRRTSTMMLAFLASLLVLQGSRASRFAPGGGGTRSQLLANAPESETSSRGELEKRSYIFAFRSGKETKGMIEKLCRVSEKHKDGMEGDTSRVDDCQLPPAVCHHVYWTALEGFSGDFSEDEVARIEACFGEDLEFVEGDQIVTKTEVVGRPPPNLQAESMVLFFAMGGANLTNATASAPSDTMVFSVPADFTVTDESNNSPTIKEQPLPLALWNLDRIDQRVLPLDMKFQYGSLKSPGSGLGVTIYVLDSGVRTSHQEFRFWERNESRASYGYDFVDDQEDAGDCDGHGTHVAATAVGRTVGVAKAAEVVSVRVLGCTGVGVVSDVVAGLDWIAQNARKPAIVTMSLGIPAGVWSTSMEKSVSELIYGHNIPVIVASGNSAIDACLVAPANVPGSITVGACDLTGKFDGTSSAEVPYQWSNTGSCVDIFAPGVDIYSACGGSERCQDVLDDSYTWASGTSMAVPLVAGVLASIFEANPAGHVADLKAQLVTASTADSLRFSNSQDGTPNRVLYSRLGQI